MYVDSVVLFSHECHTEVYEEYIPNVDNLLKSYNEGYSYQNCPFSFSLGRSIARVARDRRDKQRAKKKTDNTSPKIQS